MPPVTDTSRCPPRTSARWPRSPRAAVIVAESLRQLRCLGLSPLPAGPPVPARRVAAAIAQAIAPPLAAVVPPDFLRPGQQVAFQRLLAALERYGGAVLAEPVGTGKTYIALAAARIAGGTATAIVPAALREQWDRAARTTGVPVAVQTHEQWSRAPKPLADGLVLVDESHRFRNPATRRYGHLAPALVGRPALLLTATPVVNRLADLAHQLLLAVRDDALIGAGITSLRDTLAAGTAPHALADLVVSGTTDPPRPAPIPRHVAPPPAEERAYRSVIARLDRLGLSPRPPVRALLRCTLLAALSSSRAALTASLERYRLLLLHARDARAAGRSPGRAGLQHLLAVNPEQTLLWELLDGTLQADDLALEDERLVAGLLAWLRQDRNPDRKAHRLQALLNDGMRTIVFVNSRATVHYLRSQLQPATRVAWCTGTEAGIGPARLARRDVLAWFRPGRDEVGTLGPSVLVTTDVAAEGLDLQAAARVVHYDLPWTGVRLEQRTGRAVRHGSPHDAVELVRFEPPRAVEQRLRRAAAVLRKTLLLHRIGLGHDPHPAWVWRARTAATYGSLEATRGVAVLRGEKRGALAALELLVGERVVAGIALYHDGDGPWRDEPALLDAALRAASTGTDLPAAPADRIATVLGSLSRVAAFRVARLAGALRLPQASRGDAAAALRRIRLLAHQALQQRDPALLALAERAIRFVRRGHTSGEITLLRCIVQAEASELLALLAQAPTAGPDGAPATSRVAGLILFEPGPIPPRSTGQSS